MIITSEFFSFNVWEWFLHSSVLERTESDLSKINWLRGVILLNPIVLVPWGKFPLCHTPIIPISAFRDQISILIVGCVITRFASFHYLKFEKLAALLLKPHSSNKVGLDPSCTWIRCTKTSSWYFNGPFKFDLAAFKTNIFNTFFLDWVIGPFGTCNGSLLVFIGLPISWTPRTHYTFQMGQGLKTKTFKKALNELVMQVSAKAELRDLLEHQVEALVHLIYV